MHEKNIIRKLTIFVLLFAILTTCIGIQPPAQVKAAEQYITRFDFLKLVMKEIGTEVEGTGQDAYIQKAKEIGLLTERTFLTYDNFISKIDAAVIIVRAHEFLYGNTLSEDLIKEVQVKRISDINKAAMTKRFYLAKAYALGYIVGNSNGEYSTDRTLNPNYRIKTSYAKKIIRFLRNPKDRYVIAPDGQLTRTTNMPEFVKYYPYILASFPNKYYDWEFLYMKKYAIFDGVDTLIFTKPEYKDGKSYFSPSMIRSADYTWGNEEYNTNEFFSMFQELWVKQVKEHLRLIFNVSYRTTPYNKLWYSKVLKTDYNYGVTKLGEDIEKDTRDRLDEYLSLMKKMKLLSKRTR